MIFKESDKFIGGLIGDGIENISDSITTGFVNGFLIIIDYLITFGFWFCKVGILVCVLLFICSKDQKAITYGFRLGFIYFVIALIGGAL